MKINFQTLLIGALILIILYLRACQSPETIIKQSEPEKIVSIETKYDTIIEKVPTYIPKWRDKEIYIHDTVYIDTNKVIQDYFTKYYYPDSITKDSVIVYINDTIFKNRIASRDINYQLLYPQTTIVKEKCEPKRGLYWGFNISGNRQQINYLGPELLLTTKKKQAYGLGIGVNDELIPSISFKMYWKINK